MALRVIGWTDDMPGWLTASDVVVTNAGDNTVTVYSVNTTTGVLLPSGARSFSSHAIWS